MSRNSKKLNRQPDPDYVEPQQEVQEPPKPKFDISSLTNLSFVVPTEEVTLPTAGKFYQKDSPLQGVETVEIRYMTAKEEDFLTKTPKKGDEASLFDKLIDSLLVDTRLDSSMFMEEDKMAILIKARETGYGKEYKTLVYCDNCEEATPMTFDISKVTIKSPEMESEYNVEKDCFTFHLDMMDADVEIRKLSKNEKQEIQKDREKKESLDIDFNYTTAYIKKCLVSFQGVEDKYVLEKVIDIMPARDAKTIVDFESKCTPTISTVQNVECSVCGTETEREVPVSWAFFRTDI